MHISIADKLRREGEIATGLALSMEYLKGQCHKIFDSRFFNETSSSGTLRIIKSPFWIVPNFLEDIQTNHNSKCTTGVNETHVKWEIFFLIYFDTVR